jgi:hypothetical protein
MSKERNQLVHQTEQQANPFLARPEDFTVVEDDAQPFHSQCGDSKREYARLLAESEKLNTKSPFTGTQGRPVEPGNASPSKTGRL